MDCFWYHSCLIWVQVLSCRWGVPSGCLTPARIIWNPLASLPTIFPSTINTSSFPSLNDRGPNVGGRSSTGIWSWKSYSKMNLLEVLCLLLFSVSVNSDSTEYFKNMVFAEGGTFSIGNNTDQELCPPCACAGINRHVVGNERVLQERSSEPSWPRVLRRSSRGGRRSVDRGLSGLG